MSAQGPGTCKACLRFFKDRSNGYCLPCWETQREARDEWDERQQELDRESAYSWAEFDLKEDDDERC